MEKFDTLAGLRKVLAVHRDKRLVFNYMGQDIAPGYHITEAKALAISSIDCGGAAESWNETVIQLWDVDKQGAVHMTSGKFNGILGHVTAKVAVDDQSPLIFEVGDSASPMQLFNAGAARAEDGVLRLALVPRSATCKPMLRNVVVAEKACCDTASRGKGSCG